MRTARSAPSTDRTRPTTRIASSECPPSSKKLSSGPTSARSSTSAKIPATSSSRTVRGARPGPAAPPPSAGTGSAARSTFPLGSSGSAASTTTASGTRCPGSTPASAARSAPAAAPGATA